MPTLLFSRFVDCFPLPTKVVEHKKRPRSKLGVYQAKLERNKNIAKIIEQEDAGERVARQEHKSGLPDKNIKAGCQTRT
jgi:hypothetical protein